MDMYPLPSPSALWNINVESKGKIGRSSLGSIEACTRTRITLAGMTIKIEVIAVNSRTSDDLGASKLLSGRLPSTTALIMSGTFSAILATTQTTKVGSAVARNASLKAGIRYVKEFRLGCEMTSCTQAMSRCTVNRDAMVKATTSGINGMALRTRVMRLRAAPWTTA